MPILQAALWLPSQQKFDGPKAELQTAVLFKSKLPFNESLLFCSQLDDKLLELGLGNSILPH